MLTVLCKNIILLVRVATRHNYDLVARIEYSDDFENERPDIAPVKVN